MRRPSFILLLGTTAVAGLLYGSKGLWWASQPVGDGEIVQRVGPVVVRLPGARKPPVAKWQLAGRIIDRFGWPVVGALVEFGGRRVPVETNHRGWFAAMVEGDQPVFLTAGQGNQGVASQTVHPALDSGLCMVLQPKLPWLSYEPVEPVVDQLFGEGFLEDPDGQPAPGALVWIEETGRCTRTDRAGRYRIPLPREPVTLWARRGRGLAQLAIDAPRRQRGLVPLPPAVLSNGLSLHGSVRDPEGAPREGVTVRIEGQGLSLCAATDREGLFAVPGLPMGGYAVTVLPDRGLLGVVQEVVLRGDGTHLELPMLADRLLQLQVVDEPGAPVARAHVVITEPGERMAYAQADENGRVHVRGMVGANTRFEVRASVGHRPLVVVRYEPGAGRLVVAP